MFSNFIGNMFTEKSQPVAVTTRSSNVLADVSNTSTTASRKRKIIEDEKTTINVNSNVVTVPEPVAKEKEVEEVEDIDFYDGCDPQFCSQYVVEIYTYLKKREKDTAVSPTYFNNQTEINQQKRTFLIDYLNSVSKKFNLLRETFFLSVNLLDRYSSKKTIKLKKYQMLGITCLFIAAKFEEIYPPDITDFSSLLGLKNCNTNDLQSRKQGFVCTQF